MHFAHAGHRREPDFLVGIPALAQFRPGASAFRREQTAGDTRSLAMDLSRCQDDYGE